MEKIKSFADVRLEMEDAYTDYLKTRNEDRLWPLCHQVLSNALFLLNEDDIEDTFTYEFPVEVLANKTGVIARLLDLGVGRITKVATIPCEGVVWFITHDDLCYDDDDPTIPVWEIYNVAVALYMMTEPLARYLYK